MKKTMGKKLVLTEKQIKSIIGLNEDAFYYLGGSNPVGNTETFVEGPLEDKLGIPQPNDGHVLGLSKNDDKDGEEEYTYNDVGHKLTPSGYWSNRLGSHRTIASMYESKKKIQEGNQELSNTIIKVSDNNTGLVYGGKGDEAIVMQINRAKKSGNNEKARMLKGVLNQKREVIKGTKKAKQRLGLNAFQKEGGTKNNGGKAHTPKNNSLVTFFN